MKQIELAGDEQAVLLIHGLQGAHRIQAFAKRLHRAGYTMRAPHFSLFCRYGATVEIVNRSIR